MNSAKKAALALAVTGLAVGSTAAVASATDHGGSRQVHEHRHHPGGAIANGVAKGSPGVVSGNVIQVPIQIPLNVCGNSIDIIGLLNPTFGNTCVNASRGWDEFHSHGEFHHGGHHGGGHDKHGHDGGHWGGGHDDHDDDH
ncbi:chaplin [Streptomyces roseoverticillatus]|uniref:chaplin n=1 Tax=Streptomyces roseoverticillatus TaxID=66429 RepID=UPI001F2426DB|nr:chaplin [Streptomyces roseoverticillatus]MCF3105087.1 chaplin [Streptomyces roseoverticillatus]